MFNKTINRYSSLICKTHREQLISFEPSQSPCSSASTPSETPNQGRICFQQEVHQMETLPPLCSEFLKTIEPQILVCQSSRDKFSSYTAEQELDGSSSQFRKSLHSIVESLLCSEDNFSSNTESYSELPYWDYAPLNGQFSQEDVKLLGAAAAAVDECQPPSISSKRNQPVLQSSQFKNSHCSVVSAKPISIWPDYQQDEQSSQAHRVACATSSNSATGKRRIRWTRDLHELFVRIVNRLGGPQKAKPKAILEMMNTDLLTISQVKSHLQKYRTTMCIQKASQERHVERQGADGVTELQVKINMQIEESRQLQLEVWRNLQEQREMQRNLHLLIEQQKKKLDKMLDHQNAKSSKLEKSPVSVTASVSPSMMGPIFGKGSNFPAQ